MTSPQRIPVATQGWDSVAEIVDGVWLERTPRRPEVREWLGVEVRLMPRLAPLLPLAVPIPHVVEGDPWRVRHRMLPGPPVDPGRLSTADGELVGRFLVALHGAPAEVWQDTGIDPDRDRQHLVGEMATQVMPLLPVDLREAGRSLVERCLTAGSRYVALRHGDLGPEHLLTTDGRVSGVIDWTDVALGDPTLDLSWLVHGTPPAFRDALVATYAPSPDELARGHDWHLLGPWWEVRHGLSGGGQEYVESGLAGAVERLRAVGDTSAHR